MKPGREIFRLIMKLRINNAMKKVKPVQSDMFTRLVKSELGLEVMKEYEFDPARRWRADYFIPEIKLCIEVEGGVWTQGRHTRGKGFLGDMEKYNAMTCQGLKLIRVTPDTLIKQNTLNMIKACCQ